MHRRIRQAEERLQGSHRAERLREVGRWRHRNPEILKILYVFLLLSSDATLLKKSLGIGKYKLHFVKSIVFGIVTTF